MNDKNYIYVMKSFRIPREWSKLPLNPSDKMRGYEDGMTILFKTLEDVNSYLQDLRDGIDDRPFEMRWNTLVVEKVYFGPYSQNEIIGWWSADETTNGYNLIKLDKCPFPNCENVGLIGENFTIDS